MEQGKPEMLTALATVYRGPGEETKLHGTIRERDLNIVYITLRSYGDQGRITV